MTTEHPIAEYRPSIRRSLGLLLLTVIFTVLGVAIIRSGGGSRTIAGVVTVLLFGVIGIPAMLYLLARRPPLVTVLPSGILVRNYPLVPWNEIEDIDVEDIVWTKLVAIHLQPGAVERITAGDPPGSRAAKNDRLVLRDDVITVSPQSKGGVDALVASLREHLDEQRSRR